MEVGAWPLITASSRQGASDLWGPGRPVALPPTRHYAVRGDLFAVPGKCQQRYP